MMLSAAMHVFFTVEKQPLWKWVRFGGSLEEKIEEVMKLCRTSARHLEGLQQVLRTPGPGRAGGVRTLRQFATSDFGSSLQLQLRRVDTELKVESCPMVFRSMTWFKSAKVDSLIKQHFFTTSISFLQSLDKSRLLSHVNTVNVCLSALKETGLGETEAGL